MACYLYTIFGYKFKSEIEFLGLEQDSFDGHDVQVLIGKNPDHLPNIKRKGLLFELSKNDFLLRIKDIGSYRVCNGETIIIDPDPKATKNEIILFFFSVALGSLIHQRGNFPLHGSSIEINNKAITIIGDSAAGKSTLAAGFAQQGYKILSDDVTVILQEYDQKFLVQPGIPQIKLWKDVLKKLEINESLNKIRPNIHKYIKPLNYEFCKTPAELAAIMYLDKKNTNGFSHKIVVGTNKFDLIKNQVYRFQYIDNNKSINSAFNIISSLSQNITLFHIKRPESPLLIHELVDYIKTIVINIK